MPLSLFESGLAPQPTLSSPSMCTRLHVTHQRQKPLHYNDNHQQIRLPLLFERQRSTVKSVATTTTNKKKCQNFKNKWQIFSALCCYKCSSKKQERYCKQQHQQQQQQQQQQHQQQQDHENTQQQQQHVDAQVTKSVAYSKSNNPNCSSINSESPESVQLSFNHQDAATQQAIAIKISESENGNSFRKVSMMSETSGTEQHQQAPNEANKNAVANVCITSPPMPHPLKGSPKLYPPGRILHIVRKYSRSSTKNDKNGNFDDNVDNSNKQQQNRKENNNAILPDDIAEKESETLEKSLPNKSRLARLKRVKGNSKSQLTNLFGQFWSCKAGFSFSNQKQQLQPVYQIIETDNKQFNELLISPRMLQDHMPDNLIRCMKAVLNEPASKKPPRQLDGNGDQSLGSDLDEISYDECNEKEMESMDLATEEEAKESTQPVPSAASSALIDRRVNQSVAAKDNKKKPPNKQEKVALPECVEMSEITAAVAAATQDHASPVRAASLNLTAKNQKHQGDSGGIGGGRFPLLRNVPFVHFLSNGKQAATKSKRKYTLQQNKSTTTNANESMFDQNVNPKRHLKSMSICSYERFNLAGTTAAPLARPESYSDIMSDLENSNYIVIAAAASASGNSKTKKRRSLTLLDSKAAKALANSSINNAIFLGEPKNCEKNEEKGNDDNVMEYAEPFDVNENENNMIYYDESINFKNSLFELQQNKIKPSDEKAYARSGSTLAKANDDDRLDYEEYELKSSVIWWPYQESNSNIDAAVAVAEAANANRLDMLETGSSDECLARMADRKKTTSKRRNHLLGAEREAGDGCGGSEQENALNSRDNGDDDDDNELNTYEISLNNSAEMNHNELIENRIATSTPRADSAAALGDEHYINSGSAEEANADSPSPLRVKKRLNYFRPQRSPNLKPPGYNQATRQAQHRSDIEKNSFDEKTYISSVIGSGGVGEGGVGEGGGGEGANEINSLLKLSTTSSSSSGSSPNTASPPLNTTGSAPNENNRSTSTTTENDSVKQTKSNKYSFSSGTFTTATEQTDPSLSSSGVAYAPLDGDKEDAKGTESATIKISAAAKAANKSVTSSNVSSNNLNYDTSIDKSSNLFAASNMTSDNDNGDTSSSFSLNNSHLNAANSSGASNCNIPGEMPQGSGGGVSSGCIGDTTENKIDGDNFKSNRNDESTNTNYTSIEKLEIIKPQSKDYILCFDTSSLDHSSNQSIASGDYNQASNYMSANKFLGAASATTMSTAAATALANLSISQTIPNEKDLLLNVATNCTTGGNSHHFNIKNNNSASADCINIKLNGKDFYDYENEQQQQQQLIRRQKGDKEETKMQNIKPNNNNIDYPDSGIDTARTLSPHLFTSSLAFSLPSDDSDKTRQQLFSSSSVSSSIITSSLTNNNNSSSAIVTSTSSSAATGSVLNPNMIASVSSECSANINIENSNLISGSKKIDNNENNNYLNDSLEQESTQSKSTQQ